MEISRRRIVIDEFSFDRIYFSGFDNFFPKHRFISYLEKSSTVKFYAHL